MTTPILTTKLHFPVARPAIVLRPRLVTLLETGLQGPLTVISAPAGYGKTTLLGEWRARQGKDFATAWLSLDERDNHVLGFLNYLVMALEGAGTGLAGKTLLLLQAPSQPPVEAVLVSLADDLSGYPHNLAIVLDDYHLIDNAAVHEALKFLLEHLPPRVHLVLLTRADPPLPLARLRARGQLAEIRSADLRFTAEEAAAFLNDVMGLGLSAEAVTALEARTEGWVAGLQLAAISMQGRSDLAGFISAFTGSHRYIGDYLVEEVLNRQPAHIREFLLKTSILERLSASLCDEVLASSHPGDSQSILEHLERANIFVVALDDERRWYRYHHLFADVLRNRLQQSHPEAVPELYRRAIAWYEHNDLVGQAIQQALAVRQYESAVQLLHRHWLHLLLQGQVRATLIQWVESLPPSLMAANPRLCMVQAWMLFSAGRWQDAPRYVASVEKALESPAKDPDLASLPAEVLTFHAFEAANAGDFARALDLARQAQAIVPESALFARGAIALTLNDIHLETGHFDEALQSAQQALALTRAGGTPAGRASASYDIATICKLQGQLGRAMDTCREALQMAEAENQARFPHFGNIYLKMAAIFYEWNQLDQAARYLNTANQMAELSSDPVQIVFTRFNLIQLRQAQGNPVAALDTLHHLVPLYQQNKAVLDNTEAPAWLARWQATLGQTEEARAWLASADLTVPPWVGIKRCAILLNAARVMLAAGQTADALDLLSRIEAAAGPSVYWHIEALVLQAAAWRKKDKSLRALDCLEKALLLGEKGGFVRMFLDEAPSITDLLRQAASRGLCARYAARLLEALSVQVARPVAAAMPDLLEPLSDREHEVLRLIARGRLNKEIAGELVIAVGTVKRHTANIFRKLDVINRTQAVARSRELGLI